MPEINTDGKIRVLLADDHALIRFGLRAALELEGDIEVVGEAADGAEALALVPALQPHVILADISMPPPDGIAMAAQLRDSYPAVRVVVLTMHEDAGLARAALQAGACGYVVKRSSPAELFRAVRLAARGEKYVSAGL